MPLTRRRLPHFHEAGQPVFLTFRLHDSLPAGRTFPNGALTSGEAFVAMDRLLDESPTGPMYLSEARIAEIVAKAIVGGDYTLHAWVIMPNHVHLLITPHTGLPPLMQTIKGRTAREANRLLNRTGHPFWQDESYDHLVRNGEEFRKIERYMVDNPVKAGLVRAPELYRWSSAGWGKEEAD